LRQDVETVVKPLANKLYVLSSLMRMSITVLLLAANFRIVLEPYIVVIWPAIEGRGTRSDASMLARKALMLTRIYEERS